MAAREPIITYSIAPNGQSIRCLICRHVSHNPNDIRERYCGYCHTFHVLRAIEKIDAIFTEIESESETEG